MLKVLKSVQRAFRIGELLPRVSPDAALSSSSWKQHPRGQTLPEAGRELASGGRFRRRLVRNSLLITGRAGTNGTKPGCRHGNLRVCNINSAEISVFQSNCCSLTVGAGGDEKKCMEANWGCRFLMEQKGKYRHNRRCFGRTDTPTSYS